MDLFKKSTEKPVEVTKWETTAYQPFTKTFESTDVQVPNFVCVIVRRGGMTSEIKVSGNGTEKVVRVLAAGLRKFAADGEKDKVSVEQRLHSYDYKVVVPKAMGKAHLIAFTSSMMTALGYVSQDSQIVPQNINYFEWLTVWRANTQSSSSSSSSATSNPNNQFSFDSDGLADLEL